MSTPLAIETVDLVKQFPPRGSWRPGRTSGPAQLVLDRINLTIPTGQVFGLLGPNGAGKTTLIKILTTLIRPTSGQALVHGLDVVRHGRTVRSQIGMVYGDERSFFWRLSVRENLRFYGALYALSRALIERRIDELLELVGLTAAADRPMHHFSTGMRQRAAIARGLLSDPALLLMDEPTRGLDPLAAMELRHFIRERMVDGRRTVLVATHVMAEAEELCHRLAFLHAGRIELNGTIDELRDHLRSDDHFRLAIDCLPPHRVGHLVDLPGVHGLELIDTIDGRQRLIARTARGTAAMPDLIATIVGAGGRVWSCEPIDLSLEEIFTLAMRDRTEVSSAGVGQASMTIPRVAEVS